MHRLPSLKALQVFKLTAELGSMTKAADKLSVSQSSISRFIGLLEDELGTELFLRRDGLSLTPTGAHLAEHLNEAFRIIERGVNQVTRQHEVLRVKVTPSLAMRWLLKQTDAPEGVRFYPRWRGISPEDQDFEIGIRYGLGDWPADHAQAIYRERMVPVCAPDHLARFGAIRSASQLQHLPLIHADDHGQEWAQWVQCWTNTSITLAVETSVDTTDAAIQLALMGQGIAIVDPLFIQEDIATGTLVYAHPNAYESGESYYLVHRLSSSADEKIDRLLVWLAQRLADSGKLPTAF
jgi:LysR family transcriptional regulator, glycine cleavage system transcriptional activator